jgi:hypothetical protein
VQVEIAPPVEQGVDQRLSLEPVDASVSVLSCCSRCGSFTDEFADRTLSAGS